MTSLFPSVVSITTGGLPIFPACFIAARNSSPDILGMLTSQTIILTSAFLAIWSKASWPSPASMAVNPACVRATATCCLTVFESSTSKILCAMKMFPLCASAKPPLEQNFFPLTHGGRQLARSEERPPTGALDVQDQQQLVVAQSATHRRASTVIGDVNSHVITRNNGWNPEGKQTAKGGESIVEPAQSLVGDFSGPIQDVCLGRKRQWRGDGIRRSEELRGRHHDEGSSNIGCAKAQRGQDRCVFRRTLGQGHSHLAYHLREYVAAHRTHLGIDLRDFLISFHTSSPSIANRAWRRWVAWGCAE